MTQPELWPGACLCVHVCDCVLSGVKDGHTGTAAVLEPPLKRCYQPAAADPDSSYIEVKINSPDSPVCLSEDDGLHTFLLCTQVLCLLTSLPPPSLFFITFIYSLPSSSSSSSLSAPFLSWWRCFLLALFLVRGHVCLMIKASREAAETLPLYPSLLLSIPSSLRSLRGLAVMFNQRDRDRTFHRDKVNGTVRGLTKLLTPRQLNMNKRCDHFFFSRHSTTLNISRNKLVQFLCSASFSCQPV